MKMGGLTLAIEENACVCVHLAWTGRSSVLCRAEADEVRNSFAMVGI